MPPKAKFSKEEIVEAAYEIVRKNGEEALTAREVAAFLGVSTRPIFTYFKTMDELKCEVRKTAAERYRAYTEAGLNEKIPLRGFFKRYLSFAKENPNLYKLLFMAKGNTGEDIWHTFYEPLHATVIDSVKQIYKMDENTAESYLKNMIIVSQGFLATIVSNGCPYSENEIGKIGSLFSLALCRAYKEIPGFADGNVDVNAEFIKLIGSEN